MYLITVQFSLHILPIACSLYLRTNVLSLPFFYKKYNGLNVLECRIHAHTVLYLYLHMNLFVNLLLTISLQLYSEGIYRMYFMFILTGAELSLHFPREGETRHPANITHNFYYKQSFVHSSERASLTVQTIRLSGCCRLFHRFQRCFLFLFTSSLFSAQLSTLFLSFFSLFRQLLSLIAEFKSSLLRSRF